MQIMALSRRIRGGAGGFPRAVAHVAAAVLAVTAMLAAMWAGPLAAASVGAQPRAGLPSPASAPAPASAPVKFYIVPPPGNGPAESLYSIAAETLGDGSQFMEIFNLNRGRLQPNGGWLSNPRLIEPGWILQLPADAAGPGVHFGPLPVVTAPASLRPSRSAGTGSAIVISGTLAFLTAGLALGLVRRRAGRTRRRRAAQVRVPGVAGWSSRRGLRHDHDRYMAPRSARRGAHARTRRPHAHTWASSVTRIAADSTTANGAYVTENVLSFAPPATKPVTRPTVQPIAWPAPEPGADPEARPAAGPATKPGTKPNSRAVGRPGTRPAPKPATGPARKLESRPRQLVAIRVAAVATAALFLFACIAGTTEVALHGFRFFVFRSAGTGETGPDGLQEDQGPGQPDAPKPTPSHIKVRLSTHSTVTAHKGQ
jgi:hypothetical protein